jgi:hypothetical protein
MQWICSVRLEIPFWRVSHRYAFGGGVTEKAGPFLTLLNNVFTVVNSSI